MEIISSIYTTIRWQDIADILLTSYILFRFYILFRGTTVFRVITGIALLWFFQRVAVSLGLIVTSWVMQGFTAVAALIIIIVFRNEIRSVLQAKNLWAIFWGTPQPKEHAPVELMVQGIYELSRQSIGALLVFPGREDLEDRLQRGIRWEGLINIAMIKSIFWPGSPVHDGAAVVKGNRIMEVGAILPLSIRDNLPAAYGTRHRAALGLAEVSDALVVVVSEETGKVAVAVNGTITTMGDNMRLASVLREHLGLSLQPSRRQKREKLKSAVAAVCSLVLITGVWFSFTRGQDTLITLNVPVEYVKPDPRMEILDTSVNMVSLQLRGASSLIKSIRPEQVGVRLNLANAAAGSNTFTLTSENIIVPPGVVLNRVKPSSVEVTLDVPVVKKLPIQVDWAGKLPDDLRIEQVKVIPASMPVMGGGQMVQDIKTLYTEKIVLDKIRQSDSQTVSLALRPASLKIAPEGKEKVTVSWVIKKREP